MRRLIRVAILLLLAGLPRCGGGARPMIAAPPPAGWAEELAAERAAKDKDFLASPDTPLLAADLPSFRGLDYWPPDPSYRFSGPIERDPKPERFTILSTTGKPRPCETHGTVVFDLRGKRCRLRIYRL